jgi:hypothetical protein
MQLTLKTCSKCKVEKPTEKFGKGKQDGFRPRCKACDAEYMRAYQAKNKEVLASKKRIYAENNREELNTRAKNYREQNKESVAACKKAWGEKNKEHLTEYKKVWYKQNRDGQRARMKKWSKNNKELMAKYRKEYRDKNPAKIAANCRNYQAKKFKATPSWANTSEILDFYEAARAFRLYTGQEYHVDHIVPLRGKTVCGLHVPANLQVLLATENFLKKNKYWPDMWEKL